MVSVFSPVPSSPLYLWWLMNVPIMIVVIVLMYLTLLHPLILLCHVSQGAWLGRQEGLAHTVLTVVLSFWRVVFSDWQWLCVDSWLLAVAGLTFYTFHLGSVESPSTHIIFLSYAVEQPDMAWSVGTCGPQRFSSALGGSCEYWCSAVLQCL